MSRYLRQITLDELGTEGQRKLAKAKVLVIGAGGLGCPAIGHLVAAGVGHLTVVDPDRVDLSNLHRQLLYTTDEVGEFKAESAAQRAMRMNPDISVTPIIDFFTPDNALALVSQHDVVIDGSDNFSTRYLTNDATSISKIPLVFASLSKFQGQLSVFNYNNGPTYRCLFPEIPENAPTCAEEGVIGTLPGIMGTLQANEAIKIITGMGTPMSGKLFTLNLQTLESHVLEFKRSNSNIKALLNSYNIDCVLEHPFEKSFDELPKNAVMVDVRRERQRTAINFSHAVYQNDSQLDELISAQKTPVLFCNTGLNSRRHAVSFGKTGVLALQGGLVKYTSSQLETLNSLA